MEASQPSALYAIAARPLRATLAAFCCIAALGLLAQSGSSAAQTGTTAPRIDAELITTLSKRGDLTLRDATLGEALFTIGQTWKINLVVGEDVKGLVNGVFQDAPLHEILDSILLANDFSYRPVGKSLVIMPISKLGKANHPLLRTVVVPLRFSDPKDILPAATLLSSPQGAILEIASARSVMIVDFPDRVATITKMIQDLDEAASRVRGTGGGDDTRLDVRTFRVQYVLAASLKEPLSNLLSPDGKIATMARENKVVIVDYPPQLRLAERQFKQLDVPQTQIRITAFIYDVSLEDMKQLGINWNQISKGRFDANGDAKSLFTIDSTTAATAASGAIGSAITFMNLSRNFDITAVVNALEQANDSRLLANPTVTVLNNETAVLEAIREIPFQQLTQTQQGGNIGTIGFREAGIRLTVTARAADDGTVLLDVEPSFSRVAGTTDAAAGAQPIIDKSSAKTMVRVASGQTMVIGGLRQRTDIGGFNGVPYLKDAWLIGPLFRGKTTTVRESELIVFITPEIITQPTIDKPRYERAIGVGRDMLDRIPWARRPYEPPCDDGPIPPVDVRFSSHEPVLETLPDVSAARDVPTFPPAEREKQPAEIGARAKPQAEDTRPTYLTPERRSSKDDKTGRGPRLEPHARGFVGGLNRISRLPPVKAPLHVNRSSERVESRPTARKRSPKPTKQSVRPISIRPRPARRPSRWNAPQEPPTHRVGKPATQNPYEAIRTTQRPNVDSPDKALWMDEMFLP